MPSERTKWALAAGDVLAHYRVLAPIGSGGMAQVYLAEDVRLGRQLALKILSPRALRDEERLRRFEREARTISALNHPNILTVYDVGHDGEVQFLATEYIDGMTLRTILARGPIDVRQAVTIAIQIAQALSAAHAAGVIHRDLKPENVMIRADGYVKVLDFGLAKLAGGEAFAVGADAETQIVNTRDGLILGTFDYMAPEQARGSDVDPRVDLFALGVLLYEMLAGHPPFKGDTAADIVSAVLLRDAAPLARPDVPDALQQIVTTALQKERSQRYQTSTHLLQDLRSLARTFGSDSDINPLLDINIDTPPGVATRRTPSSTPDAGSASGESARRPQRRRGRRVIESLAVLPLINNSENKELDYFGDGLTESLINNLSQIPRLRVMARSTVFKYKGQHADPQAVGRQLGVQAVLTGHVAQRAEAFIVGAEIVDVDDGSQIWGTVLNRREADVSVLQAEISEELMRALRLRLSRDERKRLGKRHTVNAEAYQLYLRGRYFLNARTGDSLKNARALFERAVAEDPDFALAHSGIADCCSLIAVSLRGTSGRGLIEQARAAALKALQVDDALAEGHASLAFVRFRFDWDWAGAEAEFTRALALNPGHASSRQWYAMFLASRSRFDEALREMKRALDLDPLSLNIQSGIGRILHFAGRLTEAIVQYEHVIQTNPGFAQAHIDLALTWMARGEVDAARGELALARELLGQVSTVLLLEACCAVRDGRVDDARAAFLDLQQRYENGAAGADDVAMLAAVLGDWEAARRWLTEACAQRAPFLGYVDVEPAMQPLVTDPDCRAILRRHGFRARV
jgi:serine/threonine protein kinase/Tfp pilus assembly protein PilF